MAQQNEAPPGVAIDSPVVQKYLTTRFTLQRLAASLAIKPDQETHILAARIEDRVAELCDSYLRLLVQAGRPGNPVDSHCEICGKPKGPFIVRQGLLMCDECSMTVHNAIHQTYQAVSAPILHIAPEKPCPACLGQGTTAPNTGWCSVCKGSGEAP